MVLYRSPECWGYAELEQTWKYMSNQCWTSCHPCRSIRKQIWPCHKMVRVNPGSLFENIGSTRVPEAVYQVSKSTASLFRRGRFLKCFYHIWAWSCDLEHLNKFSFPTSHGGSIRKFGFNRFLRNRSLKMMTLSDLGQRSMNDFDLGKS